MKGLDLSKFKKMSSDGKCTTLKHPEGHKIIIAHNSISPAMRKQLEAIPKKYADGGETSFSDDASSAYKQVFGEPEPEQQSGQDFASRYNTPAQAPAAASDAKLSISPEERSGMDSVQAAEGPISSDNAAPEPAAPQLAAPVARTPASEEPQAPAPEPETSPEQAPAAPAPTSPQQAQYQKGYKDYYADNAQHLGHEDAAWAQDLNNGHVSRETYKDLYAKEDTLGKVGMLFGMLISGAGSGLTGQPNAVLSAMDKQIEGDYNAQVQSKSNAQNYLKIHQQQALNDAQIKYQGQQGMLTEAQAKNAQAEASINSQTAYIMKMNRSALHDQVLKVQNMPEGPQKQQAQQALAMMGTAVDAKNANLADIASSKVALLNSMGGAQGNMNGTALRMMGQKDLAEDMEKKTVPGIPGRAQIDIPQETRDRLTAQKQYDEKAREYVNFAKQHAQNWANMNLADRQKVSNQGGAMAANLQSLYRNKIKGGVYKKGEQEFIEQIIPDQPAKWSASLNAIPKVEQTIHDNQNDLKNTAGSVGLNYGGQQSQGQEGATGTSKSGKPIVFKNGKWNYK